MQFSLYSDSSKTPDTDLTCLYYISVNKFKITTLENYTFVVHCVELTLVL